MAGLVGVVAAKAILEELVELDFLLADETTLRQPSLAKQIDHRARARSRGQLNRTPMFTQDLLVVDFARISLLDEFAVLPALDRAVDQYDVLASDG